MTEADDQLGPDDHTEFKIGFNAADPDVMIIQIPIREWALDYKHGIALFHGHMREAEAVGMRTLLDIRKRKAQAGLITPSPNGSNGISPH